MRTPTLRSRGSAQDVRFCLAFPRESLTIPFMRHVLGDALCRLGVDDECVSDLLLAVTEACTNVLRHAGPGLRYEVLVRVGRNRCVLQVLDNGSGLGTGLARSRPVGRRLPPRPPRSASLLRRRHRRDEFDIASLAESGRGMAIMRACVDDVSLRSEPGGGTVVSLRKRIEWRDEAAPFASDADEAGQVGLPEPALRTAG